MWTNYLNFIVNSHSTKIVKMMIFYKGNFKDAEVLISGDDCDFCGYGRNYDFTLFEESVFGTMLQQMATGTGFIYASIYHFIYFSS